MTSMPEPSTPQESERERAVDQRDTAPVGVGIAYHAIREAAADLLPLFTAGGNPTLASWGAGLVEILEPTDDGRHRAAIVHPVASSWEKAGNSLSRIVDIDLIRATGIALLAYAETHDSLTPEEGSAA